MNIKCNLHECWSIASLVIHNGGVGQKIENHSKDNLIYLEKKGVLVFFRIQKTNILQRFPLIFSQLAVMSLVQKERAQQRKRAVDVTFLPVMLSTRD